MKVNIKVEETTELGYTIKVEIDPGDTVDEYDESADDNVISKRFYCLMFLHRTILDQMRRKLSKQG